MRGETGGIDQRQVSVDLAERLHHVAVQQDTALAAYARNFAHRLNHTCFVVCRHNRNQSRLGPDRSGKVIKIDYSIAGNVQPRHFKTFPLFQILECIQDRMMLGFV